MCNLEKITNIGLVITFKNVSMTNMRIFFFIAIVLYLLLFIYLFVHLQLVYNYYLFTIIFLLLQQQFTIFWAFCDQWFFAKKFLAKFTQNAQLKRMILSYLHWMSENTKQRKIRFLKTLTQCRSIWRRLNHLVFCRSFKQ